MARRNAVVDTVSTVSDWPEPTAAAKRARRRKDVLTIEFRSGRSGLLDLDIPRSAVWADVLNSLREAKQPAYVEIAPDTRFITTLLIPVAVTVASLTRTNSGDVEVELIVSHARHVLRRTNPDFRNLHKTLEAAQKSGTRLWVTETLDEHEIIDARPVPAPPPARKTRRK